MNRVLILSICLATGGLAIADSPTNTNPTPSPSTSSPARDDTSTQASKTHTSAAKIDLPSGVRLVASTEVGEVRAFPELDKRGKEANIQTEDVLAAAGRDDVFESDKSYQNVVAYFDGKVKRGELTQRSRTVNKTSTAWDFALASGQTESIIGRNTRPTTIETVLGGSTFERDTIERGTPGNKPSQER